MLSLATGLFGAEQLERLGRSPWGALPWIDGMTRLAFRWSLLPAFLIVSVTGALKTMGNLIMAEKVNDADWRTPDLDRVGSGHARRLGRGHRLGVDRRHGLGHLGEQRGPEQRVGRDQSLHRIRRGGAVRGARLLAQDHRAALAHAVPG